MPIGTAGESAGGSGARAPRGVPHRATPSVGGHLVFVLRRGAMLRLLAPDVWVATHKLRFWGTPVVTRMTLFRLTDGALLVIGPVPRSPELDREVAALGPVRFVVAPNRYHHLYAGEWAGHPDARLYGAPGLPKKRPDLRFHGTLGSVAPAEWAGQLDQELVAGLPVTNEVVFFHAASRTLVVTDLFFNYPPAKSGIVRLVRKLEDCDGKFTVPRIVRLLTRDRRAFARSIERILAWDFDRIVMAHGTVVESGGRALAEEALRGLR